MTFTMWSFSHYLFIVSPFLVTMLYYYLFKNKTYKQKRMIGIITSIVMILLLISRNIEIFVRKGYAYDHELIPLQICHFANFVLLYAFVKDSKSVFGFALMFNLPAAFLSILFADGLENYDTILSFRGIAYIFGHMLIVSTTLWAFIEKFAILDKKTYQNTLSITFVLFVLSVFVNNLFSIFNIGHANFFYSARPQGGTPLETFFLWGANITIGDQFMINPIYLIMMILTGLVLISSMYVLFKDIEKALINESIKKRHVKLSSYSVNT